ncbi:CRISPR-associated endonuclease Cas1 [Azotobacter vinelandii]|uniref:CRISPR-associated endonuclease Cas1 n=1 Tax=Azotobacter vinelandii TaxID=354 RepID=UPI0026671936|nr:CRISPR-associated endonuclease Cas1 [Azotobacter vinelandii]WKN24006.1 CRISPR-associated endonuclease Cas1 [Azotobacter vinelandii]
MRQLYIDRRDTRLDVDAGRLLIHVPDSPRAASLPLMQLECVTIGANTELSSRVLQALSKHGVRLVLLQGRAQQAITLTEPYRHGHAMRRIRQYALSLDETWLAEAARRLVGAKLHRQWRQLRRWQVARPDQRLALHRATRQVRELLESSQAAASRTTLLGIEGAAAAAYFAGFATVLAPSWGFVRRQRRPPPDPVNALLSLAYSMLHGDAVHALCGAGLDPSLGFLHRPAWSRESLACDLVELWRSPIDAWVWDLLRERQLRPEHFSRPQPGTCLLDKQGRQIFYPAWEIQARKWRKAMRRTASAWAEELLALPLQLPEGLNDEQPANTAD